MSAKENQRVALTKKLLQDALFKLLETEELYKISVTQLCKEAGINRSTFYKHYSTPRDVLTDMENSFIKTFRNTRDTACGDFSAKKKLLEDFCRYIYANADKVKVLLKYHMDVELSDTFIEQGREIISEHFNKRFDENDVKLVTAFIGSGVYELFRRWIMDDVPKTPEEISGILCQIVTSDWSKN